MLQMFLMCCARSSYPRLVGKMRINRDDTDTTSSCYFYECWLSSQWNFVLMYVLTGSADTEKKCKINTKAIGYLGSVNVSNQGAPCLVWADATTSSYVALLPDVRTTDAHNFCRNILGDQPWDLPSCLAMASNGSIVPQPCDIEYCGKYWVIQEFIESFEIIVRSQRLWSSHFERNSNMLHGTLSVLNINGGETSVNVNEWTLDWLQFLGSSEVYSSPLYLLFLAK